MTKRARGIFEMQLRFYGGSYAKAFNSISDEYKAIIIEHCPDIMEASAQLGYYIAKKYSSMMMYQKTPFDEWRKTRIGYYQHAWEISNEKAKTLADIHKRRFRIYDLDHIVPISYGFKNKIPAELIGSIENLRIIPHKENFEKNAKLTADSLDVINRWISGGLIKASVK
jgi:hypothetical protein